jgi:hypothetical protein
VLFVKIVKQYLNIENSSFFLKFTTDYDNGRQVMAIAHWSFELKILNGKTKKQLPKWVYFLFDMTVIEYYIGKKENVENIETSEPEVPSTQG